MTVITSHHGHRTTVNTTQWNHHNVSVSSGPRHLLGPYRLMYLTESGTYLQNSNGTWVHHTDLRHADPKLLSAAATARADVSGDTAKKILVLTRGTVIRRAGTNGTTIYTGSIPDLARDPRNAAGQSLMMGVISSLRSGNGKGDPGGSHPNLHLRMIVGRDGIVRQLSVTFRQTGTGSPATNGVYTWTLAYTRLGTTPTIVPPHIES